MRSIFLYSILALLALSFLPGSTSPAYAQDQNGTDVEVVSMTANAHWMVHYEWSIEHSAEPNSWEMWKGDRGRSLFTIVATRSDGHTAAWVQGDVCVFNRGPETTQGLTVQVDLQSSGVSISVTEATNDSPPILMPSQEACFRYRLEVPSAQIIPNGEYTVRAKVELHNPSGAYPLPEESALVNLPSGARAHQDQVQINVPGVQTWTLSNSKQIQYEQTFICDAAQGTQARTATIFETGQSAGTEVNVVCYELEVWPVTRTYFNRMHRWDINLLSDVQELALLPGETGSLQYQVNLQNQGYTDLYFRASGSIMVRNSSPLEATLTGIEAIFSHESRNNLTCKDIKFPYTLASGELLTCQYSAYPVQGESITAAASLINTNHHYSHQASNSGSTRFNSSPRAISYEKPHIIYESYECVQVNGAFSGELGVVCREATSVSADFTYIGQIGPYEQCGIYQIEERATFTPTGISSPNFDALLVSVNVPCTIGCTQPPGYWLTYSGYRQGQYDPAWDIFKGELFFKSAASWEEMIHSNTTSNPYYLLARQFVATKLNMVNGAQPTQKVSQVLQDAEFIFTNFAPHEITNTKVSLQRAMQNMAIDLDHYNRGLTGPGICPRQTSTSNR